MRRSAVLFGVWVLAGCAQTPVPGLEVSQPEFVELVTAPFFPQEAYHCGPAALATVLGAGGLAVHPDQIAPLLYVPERRGSLQIELAALPRRYDRLVVQIDGSLDAIVTQLQLGRPVLVLQNLGLARWPRWHYAVVVGFDPARDAFLLRSGQNPRQRMDRQRFFATWRRAELWGIVVLAPEEIPAGLSAQAYLKAAAGLESSGRHRPARIAFESALRRWPEEPLAHLGKANNHYQLGDLDGAAAGYRALLSLEPGHPVGLHNLVMVLVKQGDYCAAAKALPAPVDGEPELIRAARTAVFAAASSAGEGHVSEACSTRLLDGLIR